MKTKKTIQSITLCLLIVIAISANAQQAGNKQFDTWVNLLFGLNQVFYSHGFNVEGNLFYKRITFDYSHGVSLNFSGNTAPSELREQHLALHMPYSTGFGVGYRFTEWLNLRVEPKWHRFEIYYDGELANLSNRVVAYNTFTLGLGAYANWRPFKNSKSALKGIMIAPSVRYWPRVSSTLPGDKYIYDNKVTGKEETHNVMNAGYNNTPWVFNISVGYSWKIPGKH